ncbi:hypothetical protein B0H11DRAFT_713565 [Mycena galericulata]|nr:hypothetical protein B0H11DRAFT_713565 [Mycena galericulata]
MAPGLLRTACWKIPPTVPHPEHTFSMFRHPNPLMCPDIWSIRAHRRCIALKNPAAAALVAIASNPRRPVTEQRGIVLPPPGESRRKFKLAGIGRDSPYIPPLIQPSSPDRSAWPSAYIHKDKPCGGKSVKKIERASFGVGSFLLALGKFTPVRPTPPPTGVVRNATAKVSIAQFALQRGNVTVIFLPFRVANLKSPLLRISTPISISILMFEPVHIQVLSIHYHVVAGNREFSTFLSFPDARRRRRVLLTASRSRSLSQL